MATGPSITGRQAANPCGFVVTAASECPAQCTAAPITRLVDALTDRFSCKKFPPATSSAKQTNAATGITTVVQTYLVTVTDIPPVKTPLPSSQGSIAPSGSSVGLVEASIQSPASAATSASETSGVDNASASSTRTPAPANFAAGHSKGFAQTTGGILTITFLTLGILAAIILAIIFQRRRRRRQLQQNAKASEEGEPMAELPGTRYGSGIVPGQGGGASAKDQPKSTDTQHRDSRQTLKPASGEVPPIVIAPNSSRLSPLTERSGFSTATTYAPNNHFRPASSVYPEDQIDPKDEDHNPFVEQSDLPIKKTSEVSGPVDMAQKQREWEAQGGYGIPEVPPHLIRRPKETLSELVDREAAQLKASGWNPNAAGKLPTVPERAPSGRRQPVPLMDQLTKMTEREEGRTDRWDPDMPRGPPPIPEKSVRRLKSGEGSISRKPVGREGETWI